MDFRSFVTSFATSFIIFVVLVLLFTWLSRRPGNEVVYYPSRLARGMDPWEGRRRTRNPLAWIREAVGASEEELVATAGVDAAVYITFLSTALGILILSGVVLLPLLLPVARTDNNLKLSSKGKLNETFNDLDRLSMANVKITTIFWIYIFEQLYQGQELN